MGFTTYLRLHGLFLGKPQLYTTSITSRNPPRKPRWDGKHSRKKALCYDMDIIAKGFFVTVNKSFGFFRQEARSLRTANCEALFYKFVLT